MDKTKSLIRHILTALGTIMLFFNVPVLADIIQTISENLDQIFTYLTQIIGAVTALVGFFYGREDSIWSKLKGIFRKSE